VRCALALPLGVVLLSSRFRYIFAPYNGAHGYDGYIKQEETRARVVTDGVRRPATPNSRSLFQKSLKLARRTQVLPVTCSCRLFSMLLRERKINGKFVQKKLKDG